MQRVTGRRSVMVLGLLAALAVPLVLMADNQISITSCPFSIAVPGHYVVDADLTCVGDGIDITASQVDLRLNGHVITGSTTTNSSMGIYVEGGQRRVHIEVRL